MSARRLRLSHGANPETLVPMSMEELRQRGYKNARRKSVIQLWFVDGLGNGHLLLGKEIASLGLDGRWPWYMKSDVGIRRINQERRTT